MLRKNFENCALLGVCIGQDKSRKKLKSKELGVFDLIMKEVDFFI